MYDKGNKYYNSRFLVNSYYVNLQLIIIFSKFTFIQICTNCVNKSKTEDNFKVSICAKFVWK